MIKTSKRNVDIFFFILFFAKFAKSTIFVMVYKTTKLCNKASANKTY